MTFPLRFAVLCALPLALAACQGEKKQAGTGTAQGEILSASASDAMLPLDTVRSQPPLAPPTAAGGGAGKAAARGGATGTAEERDETPPPSPAPSIAAETVD